MAPLSAELSIGISDPTGKQCIIVMAGVGKGNVELNTVVFWKLDSCLHLQDCSSLISRVMIVTMYEAGAHARLIQLTAYPVLSQVCIVTIIVALRALRCQVSIKFLKCDFGFTTVVQHSLPIYS